MSNATTLPAAPRLRSRAWQRFTATVVAASGNAWRRWRQQSRRLDEQAAVRSLDRRVRQDLGLIVEDAAWRDVPASAYERMRW